MIQSTKVIYLCIVSVDKNSVVLQEEESIVYKWII